MTREEFDKKYSGKTFVTPLGLKGRVLESSVISHEVYIKRHIDGGVMAIQLLNACKYIKEGLWIVENKGIELITIRR